MISIFLTFRERFKLDRMYSRWTETNGYLQTPQSFIIFLDDLGVLDKSKIREILKGEKNEQDNSC